uniref:Deoxyribonuclease II n=1 Tax=Steinernema glaseri TaxID=37863 RepID=A0A1I7Z905_9BILA
METGNLSIVIHPRTHKVSTVTSRLPSVFVKDENFINKGAIFQTISGIRKHKEVKVEVEVGAYSDQGFIRNTDKQQNSNRAHSKGFYAFGKKTGFHVLHSIPKGPYFRQGETFDDPSEWWKYSSIGTPHSKGQTLFCISMSKSSIKKLLKIVGTNVTVSPYYCDKQQCEIDVASPSKSRAIGVRDTIHTLGGVQVRAVYHGMPDDFEDDNGQKRKFELDAYLAIMTRHNGNAYFASQSWVRASKDDRYPSYCAKNVLYLLGLMQGRWRFIQTLFISHMNNTKTQRKHH